MPFIDEPGDEWWIAPTNNQRLKRADTFLSSVRVRLDDRTGCKVASITATDHLELSFSTCRTRARVCQKRKLLSIVQLSFARSCSVFVKGVHVFRVFRVLSRAVDVIRRHLFLFLFLFLVRPARTDDHSFERSFVVELIKRPSDFFLFFLPFVVRFFSRNHVGFANLSLNDQAKN